MRYKAITGLDEDRITHLAELLVQVMPWDPRRTLDPVRAVVMTLEYLRHNTAQAVLAFHYRASRPPGQRRHGRGQGLPGHGHDHPDEEAQEP